MARRNTPRDDISFHLNKIIVMGGKLMKMCKGLIVNEESRRTVIPGSQFIKMNRDQFFRNFSFRYSWGRIPVCFSKALKKVVLELKPMT